jgi:type I restriction enzyme S subunit
MTDWPTKTLGELFESKPKNFESLKQKDYLSSGRFPVVDQGQELVGGFTNDQHLVRDFGDPVIVFGDHTRCVKYVDFPFVSGADGTKVLVPRKGVDPKFGYFQLLSIKLPTKGYARHFGELSKHSFVLPPLDQQKRIVALLDAATARVTEITACYEQARTHANNLYESACRTEFDNQHLKSPITTLPDVCKNLDGRRKPITKSDREAGDIPYYGASGIVDYVKGYIFDERTLLISEDGANLLARSTPIAFTAEGKYWVNNHAHVVKFENIVTETYVEIFLNSIPIDNWVTGAAQPKLTQAALNRIPIPMPPLEDQKQIVVRLDSIRTKTSAMVAAYDAKLTAAKNLRQSILESAFEGRL